MIERVVWVDSGMHYAEEWKDLDVFKSLARGWNGLVTTVGTLMFEDENVVLLGLSHDESNDNWFGAQLIWKKAIESREEL